MGKNLNREEHSNITIFVTVALAFFLKLLICVASKVDFKFFKALRILKRAINHSRGFGGPVRPPMSTEQNPVEGKGQSLHKFS